MSYDLQRPEAYPLSDGFRDLGADLRDVVGVVMAMIMSRTEEELYKINEENFARQIAAKAEGLEDDREGKRLPDDLWRRYIPQAQRWLAFEVTDRFPGYAHVTVQGTCPLDATEKEVEERFYHWYFGGRNAWVKDGRFGCTIHTD